MTGAIPTVTVAPRPSDGTASETAWKAINKLGERGIPDFRDLLD